MPNQTDQTDKRRSASRYSLVLDAVAASVLLFTLTRFALVPCVGNKAD